MKTPSIIECIKALISHYTEDNNPRLYNVGYTTVNFAMVSNTTWKSQNIIGKVEIDFYGVPYIYYSEDRANNLLKNQYFIDKSGTYWSTCNFLCYELYTTGYWVDKDNNVVDIDDIIKENYKLIDINVEN